jgi:nucleolysin TIA-1/TIAR
VGNLPNAMPDMLLYEIFSTIAPIANWKVIKDKSSGKSLGYGFVDYYDHEAAKAALESLNGRKILDSEIKVNWAHIANGNREEAAGYFTLFVGDLSGDVNDKTLQTAFAPFGDVKDARVMIDPNTGRSRGFGFISYRTKQEAETALGQMNGEWLGSRAVRVNWANQKNQSTPTPAEVFEQGTESNTSVYVGNLPSQVTEDSLRQLFSEFSQSIEQIRIYKGFAFVHFNTHQQAKQALTTVSGRTLMDRHVKCGWGKERPSSGSSGLSAPTSPVTSSYSTSPAGSMAAQYPPYSYPQAGMEAYSSIAYYPQYYGAQYYGYPPSAPAYPAAYSAELGPSILGLPSNPNNISKP